MAAIKHQARSRESDGRAVEMRPESRLQRPRRAASGMTLHCVICSQFEPIFHIEM